MTENSKSYEQNGFELYPETSLEELERVKPGDTLNTLQTEARQYSRRGFLAIAGRAAAITGIGLAAGGEALRLDTRVGEMLNPSERLSWEHVAAAASPEYADHATLFVPGFNVYSAQPAADAMKAALVGSGNVAALHHASDHFSIDNLVATTRNYITDNNITSLTVVGSSLGGMIAVELAGRIDEVGLVVVDSSPADPSDALGLPDGFLKAVAESASWVMDTLDMSGGPGARTTIEFVKRLHDGDKTALRCLKEALSVDYTRSCPNPLVLDLFTYLITHNVQSQDNSVHNFDLLYLGADDPTRDPIVDQRSAVLKYRAFTEERGVLFAHAVSDKTAHADIAVKGEAYSSLYLQGVKEINEQRRAKNRLALGTMGFRILGR